MSNIINFSVFIIFSLYAFNVSYGRLDTNISVRAGNKGIGRLVEEYPLFSAFIFTLAKALPFIFAFGYVLRSVK